MSIVDELIDEYIIKHKLNLPLSASLPKERVTNKKIKQRKRYETRPEKIYRR